MNKIVQFTEYLLTAYVEIVKAIAELAGGLLRAFILICGLILPVFVVPALLISMFV
jgi:hypothetical protein